MAKNGLLFRLQRRLLLADKNGAQFQPPPSWPSSWLARSKPASRARTLQRAHFRLFGFSSTPSLKSCEQALEAQRSSVLQPGGRLAVISFHSLEDRIVKQFIAKHSREVYDRRAPFAAPKRDEAARPWGASSRRRPRSTAIRARAARSCAWPSARRGRTDMTRLNLLLLIAVLASAHLPGAHAVPVAPAVHRAGPRAERGAPARVDHERLQVEKRAQATPLRVEKLAQGAAADAHRHAGDHAVRAAGRHRDPGGRRAGAGTAASAPRATSARRAQSMSRAQRALHDQPAAREQDAGLAQQVHRGRHRARLRGAGRPRRLRAGDRQRLLPAPGRGALRAHAGAAGQPRPHPRPQRPAARLQRAGAQHLGDPEDVERDDQAQARAAGQAAGDAAGRARQEAGRRGQDLRLAASARSTSPSPSRSPRSTSRASTSARNTSASTPRARRRRTWSASPTSRTTARKASSSPSTRTWPARPARAA